MSEPVIDKQIVDAVLDVLHDRKGFDWWWEGEIGAANRASIKRQARAKVRAILMHQGASGRPSAMQSDASQTSSAGLGDTQHDKG